MADSANFGQPDIVKFTLHSDAKPSVSSYEETPDSAIKGDSVKWRKNESGNSLSSGHSTSTSVKESSGRKSPYRKKNGLTKQPLPCPPPHPFFPVDQNFDGSKSHSRGGANHHYHLKFKKKSAQKQVNSIARSRLYHSLSSLDKKGKLWSKFYAAEDENIKRVLDAVSGDHLVLTDPADNRNRRTLVIDRGSNEKFGFTIQSYIFKNCVLDMLERLSYVDNVEIGGPGYFAGLRRGDVILSINGKSVRDEDHESVVRLIGECLTMRLVVLFEDCAQKIDLFSRAIKLKKLLSDKEFELRILDLQESRLIEGLPLLNNDETLSYLRSSTTASSPALSVDSKSLSIPPDWCLEEEGTSLDEEVRSSSPSSASEPGTLEQRLSAVGIGGDRLESIAEKSGSASTLETSTGVLEEWATAIDQKSEIKESEVEITRL